jgi:hypothetical protein
VANRLEQAQACRSHRESGRVYEAVADHAVITAIPVEVASGCRRPDGDEAPPAPTIVSSSRPENQLSELGARERDLAVDGSGEGTEARSGRSVLPPIR